MRWRRTRERKRRGSRPPLGPPGPPRLIQRMESGYESSERTSSPVGLETSPADRDGVLMKTPSSPSSPSSSGPSWRNTRSRSSGALLQELGSSRGGRLAPPSGPSELDQLQEEVQRRAREEEQQRRQEKEREAALGFNPRPSKYLDLDQLQIQGKGDSFERCVSEAELLLDQSVRLEQAGEVTAALSAVNEAVSRLQLAGSSGGAGSQGRLQRCLRRGRGLQQRLQQHQDQDQDSEEPSEKPLSLQILLTDRQSDQSASSVDQPAPPLPPTTNSVSALSPGAGAPTGSPRGDGRAGGPCSRFGKPQGQVAPPPPPEEAEHPARWTQSQAIDRSHVTMEEGPFYPRQPPKTPPTTPHAIDRSHVTPPPPTPPRPPVARTPSPPSPPPPTRAAQPVERWAENVNRYYVSQNAPGEELSELESLYQASLLAPSMHRGSRGVSPQPMSNNPGLRSGRSKTPTAEIERNAFRSPEKPSGEDESYSAANLRRLVRSLSGAAIRPRPQNPGSSHSWEPSVSLRHSSSLPRRPSNPSSSSTADPSLHHLLRHPPPSQTPRPPTEGPPRWTGSGPPQPLVSGPSLHSVALRYATLPRGPRRAPPPPSPPSSSGPAPPLPHRPYATLSHPRRSAASNARHRQPSLPVTPGSAPWITGPAHWAPGSSPQSPGSAYWAPSSSPQPTGSASWATGSAYHAPGSSPQSPGSAYLAPGSYQSSGSAYQSSGSAYQAPGSSPWTPDSSTQSTGSAYHAPGSSPQLPGSAYLAPGSAYLTPGSSQSSGSAYHAPGSAHWYPDSSQPPGSAPYSPASPRSPGSAHWSPGSAPPQPLRLDVPPETDWRRATPYRTGTAPPGPPAPPRLCSLCRLLPAEPRRPCCPSCSAARTGRRW